MCEYEGEEEVLDSNGQKILDGKVERVTPHLGEISADSPFFYELNYTYSTDYMNQDISLRYYDIKGDMLCDINLLEIEDIDRAMYDRFLFPEWCTVVFICNDCMVSDDTACPEMQSGAGSFAYGSAGINSWLF